MRKASQDIIRLECHVPPVVPEVDTSRQAYKNGTSEQRKLIRAVRKQRRERTALYRKAWEIVLQDLEQDNGNTKLCPCCGQLASWKHIEFMRAGEWSFITPEHAHEIVHG